MGLVRMGPPLELLAQLKERYQITSFIETGTYRGDTAVWAASYFQRVLTVERSKVIYDETRDRHGMKHKNIDFLFGDSVSALKQLIGGLTGPSVFWLDAHWCGGYSSKEDGECPLLNEIETIHCSHQTHFLFIDDARLFTSPPPEPLQIDQWPSIDQVIHALQSGHKDYYIVIHEDVIMAVPQYAKEVVSRYCQEINTWTWRTTGTFSVEPEITQGRRLVGRGIRLMGRGVRTQLSRSASKLLSGMRRR
jgi:hypothetical protein